MSNNFDDMPFFDEDAAPAKADAKPEGSKPMGSMAARAMAARSGSQAAPDYLSGLNPEQRQAVETVDGPVLVLAGAGTGKTRVLTTRIAHILATNRAYPNQILAVTFTNKAAREMRQRISLLVGDTVEGMAWLGTFHSVGVKLLRRHAELVGLKSGFTILDTDDVIRLIKQLIQAEGLDEKRWPARQFAMMIDNWKNKGLGPKEIAEGDARAFGNGKGRKLFEDYQTRLQQLNCVDFGDLLCLPLRIFRENADILADYQRRFKYILVDEYQDTNVVQYALLKLLAGAGTQADGAPHPTNICCVGDDDQSIYGWRGAEVENILRFDKDFRGALVIKLERNYRSTAHILGAASHLIANNEDRLGKTLFTDRADPDDAKVMVHAPWDSEEEARKIGDEIEALQSKGHKLNNIAILMRASFQMREFEDRFVTLGLNYRVIGGPRFYERREIRDAMAYFRVICQPADDLAFERIVNVPKRGLGDTSVKFIHEYARKRDIPMLQASEELSKSDEMKARPRSILRQLVEDFTRWQGLLENMRHTDLAEQILDESGYTAMWQADRDVKSPERLENLKELIRSMEEFESLRGFMEHVSLVMDVENNENLDAVSLMTLHSAKGLEFETVFLPGWEEGLFPHQRALDEGGKSGLEEERRLAYVGITRAKRRCHIWFASNRRIHGLWQSTIPSRFVDELPEAHCEVAESDNGFGGHSSPGASRFDQVDPFTNSYATPGWKRAQSNANEATRTNWGSRSGTGVERIGYGEIESSRGAGRGSVKGRMIEGELVAKSVSDMPSQFSIDDRVFHIKFGNGTVMAVEGNKLTVSFDKAGEKRVLESFLQSKA